jgi:tRNA threonylcarbamoyladenosine biosynthesis protein TsaE
VTLQINSIAELETFVKNNKDRFKNKIVFLYGDLGAGKTTFVKILSESLGFTGASSPTFTLLNIYHKDNEQFYHFDLYRLNSLIELENIGFFDYIETGATICIEWANKFDLKHYLDNYIEIYFEKVNENKRLLNIKYSGD